MGIGKQRISLAVRGLAARVADRRVLVPEPAPAAAKLEQGRAAVALELDPVAAALEHDPVEVEREHDPGVEEPEHDPVAVELELVLAAAELELVPVVAAPERVPVAVPLRTKSVIAVHHRGRVPLLAGEDLVVAAETTREPVAAEAVIAWEAAE
jgi:hypothetical protein